MRMNFYVASVMLVEIIAVFKKDDEIRIKCAFAIAFAIVVLLAIIANRLEKRDD